MFGSKGKGQKENVATLARTPAGSTVHNHARGYQGEIVASFICLLIFLFIGWNFMIEIGQEMGVKNPKAAIGAFASNLAQLIVVSWMLFYFGGKILKPVLTTWKELQLAREETKVQLARIQLQQVQALPVGSSRTFGDDARKALIIQTVMGKAYQFIEENGRNYKHSDSWPWAWRNVYELEVDGKKVGEIEARKVRGWLEEYGMIKDNEVNLDQFRNLNTVNRYLRMRFEMPVIRGSLPYSTGGDYEHIENSE